MVLLHAAGGRPRFEARQISARNYRKIKQNVTLAFLFSGIGVPLAATGLLYPVWAIFAMAVSVTLRFVTPCRAARRCSSTRSHRRPPPGRGAAAGSAGARSA